MQKDTQAEARRASLAASRAKRDAEDRAERAAYITKVHDRVMLASANGGRKAAEDVLYAVLFQDREWRRM